MRLGLCGARADRRGLAAQTFEFARHMTPDRILGVEDPGSPEPDWAAWPTRWGTVNGRTSLDARIAGRFLAGMDTVWGAETFYMDRFCAVARQGDVKSVLHVNPEFWRFDRLNLPKPDVVLNPTSWLNDRVGGTVFPFPVDRDRCRYVRRPEGDGPVRFLHVVGHPAMHDRNGTQTLLRALTLVRHPAVVTVKTQGALGGDVRVPAHVTLDVQEQDADDYWRLYDGHDVLVMPRRYGGQSLVMNEAASSGLAVVATDCEPQSRWLHPSGKVPVRRRRNFRSVAGPVPLMEADPRALAAVLDRLSQNPDVVAAMSAHSDAVAETISWKTLKPRFAALLAP